VAQKAHILIDGLKWHLLAGVRISLRYRETFAAVGFTRRVVRRIVWVSAAVSRIDG